MKVEVLKKSLLESNENAAQLSRALLDEHGVVAVNIMGGAGCGKTTLLEHTIPQLASGLSVAVLEGDVATTKDADRIAALGVPVVQLLTEGGCHLTASLVEHGLRRLPLASLDLVLIENVGNPICPASFNLGEHRRLAVLSVTEGDDKPAKYPLLFKVADRVVITKTDLLEATDFDMDQAATDIRVWGADKPIDSTSAKEPSSMRPVAEWLRGLCTG